MSKPQYFVVTDIEGVAGIDSFETTRTSDDARKAPAMDQLAREVAAAVDGIRSVHPDAVVDVWDGHGTGGLRESDVTEATISQTASPTSTSRDTTGCCSSGNMRWPAWCRRRSGTPTRRVTSLTTG